MRRRRFVPEEERGIGALRVALLMDTLKHERWQRDRDLFIARAKERGAAVILEAAEGDAARQLAQAQSALDKGAKVLVVVPHDAQRAGDVVEAARARNVPVISGRTPAVATSRRRHATHWTTFIVPMEPAKRRFTICASGEPNV